MTACVGRGLGSGESIAVHFEEKYPDDESDPLISVREPMIPDDAGRIGGRHGDEIGVIVISEDLARARDGRFQKIFVSHAAQSAVKA
jgi:hypothetical protein